MQAAMRIGKTTKMPSTSHAFSPGAPAPPTGELVVVPEVAGVEHVPPGGEEDPADVGVVGEQVDGPAERVERGVEHDHVADERHDDRPHGQALALCLALQGQAPEEQRQAEDAEHGGAHEDRAADEPPVGLLLCPLALVDVVVVADRAAAGGSRFVVTARLPAPLRPHAQLDEEHRQQVAVDDDLEEEQGSACGPGPVGSWAFPSSRDAGGGGAAGSRVAAATSRRASVTAPSELSGPRMQTSAASSSLTPAATRCAAVTSVRVEGGSRWKAASAPRIDEAQRTSRAAASLAMPVSATSTSTSRSAGR